MNIRQLVELQWIFFEPRITIVTESDGIHTERIHNYTIIMRIRPKHMAECGFHYAANYKRADETHKESSEQLNANSSHYRKNLHSGKHKLHRRQKHAEVS